MCVKPLKKTDLKAVPRLNVKGQGSSPRRKGSNLFATPNCVCVVDDMDVCLEKALEKVKSRCDMIYMWTAPLQV
jgi:hypothetical protein